MDLPQQLLQMIQSQALAKQGYTYIIINIMNTGNKCKSNAVNGVSGDKTILTHKPSYVKKPRVPGRPTKSKQISTLVSQQVAAEMQKYNKSAHIDSTNIADKVAADDE